ncbi:type I-E CRISPR-associated protein Cas7/Cse4/CasC [Saccharothrix longispora]|uniref:type I-E CRISPR-associated protein Cas7/Cse4/CasC n=1 Tax=Saccharothrix longispora TaxID=33920 RepID=UPI0028FD7851|nr:type I-E CRISPR-associated protein Cas7/Cse4/CasC [Saccharothrix longispora]MDU0289567.1 type I-E CRISPR-associated protein Cas7/Cse4/CasC [Saccharothrix longispora]
MHIDIHVLHSVPYSNMNRDGLGSPKETIYGGKVRTRISSQSWKRAVREEVEKQLGESTVRTRAIATGVAEVLVGRGWEADSARKAGRAVLFSADATAKRAEGSSGGVAPDNGTDLSKVLFWVPTTALAELADLCEQHRDAIETTSLPDADGTDENGSAGDSVEAVKKPAKGRAKGKGAAKPEIVLPSAQVDTILRRRSATINLLGRMLAEMPGHNVDGATLFAHAFTTHETSVDFDFFTAVDDLKPSTGSGHLDTAQYASGVFYRYSSVNIVDLTTNIGDSDDALTVIDTYLRAFCSAMPSGKQRTTGAMTPPDLVHLALRRAPLSLAGAFEKPVLAGDDGGYAEPSRARIAHYTDRVHKFLGKEALLWHGHASVDDGYVALGERHDSLHDLITAAMNETGDRT